MGLCAPLMFVVLVVVVVLVFFLVCAADLVLFCLLLAYWRIWLCVIVTARYRFRFRFVFGFVGIVFFSGYCVLLCWRLGWLCCLDL